MAKHFIPTVTRRDGSYDSDAIVRVKGATRSGGPGGWGVSGWGAEGKGRLVFQGPLVSGPHASLFGRACFMDNFGGTAAQHDRADKAGLLFDVKAGDILVIDGVEYTLSIGSWGYPKLKGGEQ